MFIRPVLMVFVLLSVLLGLVYPMSVTAVAQWWFPKQANGSLVVEQGQARGSELLGQAFSQDAYVWARLSATGDYAYNPMASSGSNWAATHADIAPTAKERLQLLGATAGQVVPVELLTQSGSGLDPDISLQAALFQAKRVAKARGVSEQQVVEVVHQSSRQGVSTGYRPLVNVLALNLALDRTLVSPSHKAQVQ